MNDIKDRLDKADDRIKVLVKKYPVVFAITAGVPFLIGLGIGAFFL